MQEPSDSTPAGWNETLVDVPSEIQLTADIFWIFLIPVFLCICLWCIEAISSYCFACTNQWQVSSQEEIKELPPPQVLSGNLIDLFKKSGNQMVRST
jgi:hypothetical protein